MPDEKGNPTYDELKARLVEMEKASGPGPNEVVIEANGKQRTIGFKVSETTGAISVTGLQRFPVTLYADQWEIVLDGKVAGALLDFIELHRAELPVKPEAKKRQTNAEKASAVNGAGITLSPNEVGMIPGMINKYQGNSEAQAALMTLRDCHELNGKVAFEPYAKFRALLGK